MSTSFVALFGLALLSAVGFFVARNKLISDRRTALQKIAVRIERFRR